MLKEKSTHTIKNPETRNPSNENSLAFRLAYALKARNLLAKDICLKTGIRKSTMSLYVNGKSVPSRERSIILSNVLRVDLDWLYGKSPLNAFTKYNDFNPDEDLDQLKDIWAGLNKNGRQQILAYAHILLPSGKFNVQ